MNREDIIEMAKEAKLPYEWETGMPLYLDKLEHFVDLVKDKMEEEVEREFTILFAHHMMLLGELRAIRERKA